MSRHQQTERNDLRPKSIDDEFLERLGVPIVDSGADGPEYSLFAVDNVIDGTRLFYKADGDEIELGVEPPTLTEGLFPELFG